MKSDQRSPVIVKKFNKTITTKVDLKSPEVFDRYISSPTYVASPSAVVKKAKVVTPTQIKKLSENMELLFDSLKKVYTDIDEEPVPRQRSSSSSRHNVPIVIARSSRNKGRTSVNQGLEMACRTTTSKQRGHPQGAIVSKFDLNSNTTSFLERL
jgi:hypothetical protein